MTRTVQPPTTSSSRRCPSPIRGSSHSPEVPAVRGVLALRLTGFDEGIAGIITARAPEHNSFWANPIPVSFAHMTGSDSATSPCGWTRAP